MLTGILVASEPLTWHTAELACLGQLLTRRGSRFNSVPAQGTLALANVPRFQEWRMQNMLWCHLLKRSKAHGFYHKAKGWAKQKQGPRSRWQRGNNGAYFYPVPWHCSLLRPALPFTAFVPWLCVTFPQAVSGIWVHVQLKQQKALLFVEQTPIPSVFLKRY